ncbi:hypothetical protein GCM10010449_24780 [Streptomyces rectiviolaceus]|uniref:Uncharacterized protein n=1 Tax=Streptomyces rectiviolaceus TaxID=332591 RepID=A0ABP6MCK1_9ACTN
MDGGEDAARRRVDGVGRRARAASPLARDECFVGWDAEHGGLLAERDVVEQNVAERDLREGSRMNAERS